MDEERSGHPWRLFALGMAIIAAGAYATWRYFPRSDEEQIVEEEMVVSLG